jgi:hypothetical protein
MMANNYKSSKLLERIILKFIAEENRTYLATEIQKHLKDKWQVEYSIPAIKTAIYSLRSQDYKIFTDRDIGYYLHREQAA